jgi:nitroimidazol reductase NimA-like FMN-containing flavoprotein (pyridoxamine 5'-phosphate oxidase superfamily)
MPETRDLDALECRRLLRAHSAGRVALATPDGPHIVPVVYAVVDETVVIRTSPYSILGAHGRRAMLALEVGSLDEQRGTGWSVVVRGRSWVEADPDGLARIRDAWAPRLVETTPGSLVVRLHLDSVSGRTIVFGGMPGDSAEPAGQPHTLTAS